MWGPKPQRADRGQGSEGCMVCSLLCKLKRGRPGRQGPANSLEAARPASGAAKGVRGGRRQGRKAGGPKLLENMQRLLARQGAPQLP